jgi:hypothetical protein
MYPTEMMNEWVRLLLNIYRIFKTIIFINI